MKLFVLLPTVRRRLKALLPLVLALLISGCVSGRLTDTWQSAYQGAALRHVLVIGLSAEAGTRHLFEEEFAMKLQTAGVATTASRTEFPERGKVADEKLYGAIVRSRADGVLITRIVRIDRRSGYNPGHIGPVPTTRYRRSLYGYYSAAWAALETNRRISDEEVAVIETSLWSTRDGQLIWSASTETYLPQDVRSETPDFAAEIVAALGEAGLI